MQVKIEITIGEQDKTEINFTKRYPNNRAYLKNFENSDKSTNLTVRLNEEKVSTLTISLGNVRPCYGKAVCLYVSSSVCHKHALVALRENGVSQNTKLSRNIHVGNM